MPPDFSEVVIKTSNGAPESEESLSTHSQAGHSAMARYSKLVLAIEFICATGTLSYGLCLISRTVPRSTAVGLKPARPENKPDPSKPEFHVRILVPCYKEDIATIRTTMEAALNALLPNDTLRTVYLCDDGRSRNKRLMVEQWQKEGKNVVYSRRPKHNGQKDVNGKSMNLNYCLRIVYQKYLVTDKLGEQFYNIPNHEVVVVFDADQVAHKDFYLKVLSVMQDRYVALCLTPQHFSNIPEADIFNNANAAFWEYMLPGLDSMGYVACTGTNFCIRADALADCNFFPDWTVTEDYTLGMELKKRGYKAVYLSQYLVTGEAPMYVRDILKQRSRWCKGQMQVLFSSYCPLSQVGLSPDMRLLYTAATWCYITDFLSVPFYALVPVLSTAGNFPVVISAQFASAAIAYYVSNVCLLLYFHSSKDIPSLWNNMISNYLLWFTFFKAMVNTLWKNKIRGKDSGFKVTEKAGQKAAEAETTSGQGTSQLNDEDKEWIEAEVPVISERPPPPQPPSAWWVPVNLGPKVTWDFFIVPGFPGICSIIAFAKACVKLNQLCAPFDNGACWYLSLNLVWSIYNFIPPLLFVIYLYSNGRFLARTCRFCQVVQLGISIFAIIGLYKAGHTIDAS